jgi:hypothetical protein
MALDQEKSVFDEHREEWHQQYPGKFVVIKGDEVVGFFDTLDLALSEGAKRFGLTPFMARSVSEPDQEVSIPAMALGVLRADPTYAV